MLELPEAQPADAEQPPLMVLPHTLRMPSMPSPKQMVSALYDPDEFEEFVKEWVPALGSRYTLVERHGGTGDHGIDVAGYLSQQKLEGEWHNYQCKRYASALGWSTAVVEMRKMFVFAEAGHFTVPTRYVFVAPRFARSLQQVLAKPTEAKDKFVKELDTAKDTFFTDLTATQRKAVKDLATAADFSIFECANLDEILELHSTTRHWAERFPHAPLRRGPDMIEPPAQHRADETRYVQHLVDVYRERFPGKITSLEHVASVEEAHAHLKRQRVAFYAAESLRAFARDSTPSGYFERLREDVFDIVVEVAERTYPDGWERHAAVAETAGLVQLTPTILTPYVQPNTRKGICHHLANEDRLIWCRKGEK
ncbi:ABC-three component system protein [Microbispora bryophytorum]|uniref:ABC-three component system protein n=1 Tax=Microbispora bryophytorum TaxID=1460882 RepID=UPI0033C60DF4